MYGKCPSTKLSPKEHLCAKAKTIVPPHYIKWTTIMVNINCKIKVLA